jgi:hypothetical protein
MQAGRYDIENTRVIVNREEQGTQKTVRFWDEASRFRSLRGVARIWRLS